MTCKKKWIVVGSLGYNHFLLCLYNSWAECKACTQQLDVKEEDSLGKSCLKDESSKFLTGMVCVVWCY